MFIIFFTCHHTETTRHCLIDIWSIYIVIYWLGSDFTMVLNYIKQCFFKFKATNILAAFLKQCLNYKTNRLLQLTIGWQSVWVRSDIRSTLFRRNSWYLLIASFHSNLLAADASIHKLHTFYKHVKCYYVYILHFSTSVTQFDLICIQTCVKYNLYCIASIGILQLKTCV